MTPRRRERGIVLVLVLVVGLLLSTAVIAFARRATVDAHIGRNRDDAASADALARGGVQIAIFLIAGDKASQGEEAPPEEGPVAEWARARDYRIQTEDGGSLRLDIRDEGARLNINAVLEARQATDEVGDETVEFLTDFFEKVIDELPGPPGGLRDARELAYNLIDYVDENEERVRGGSEDGWYQDQSPPRLPANEPLRTFDELGRVEGFDRALVEGLRPYLTVHPRSLGGGINPNTAPPHVLAAIYHGNPSSRVLASEDTVRQILRVRAEGRILCSGAGGDDRCILASELIEGSAFPPLSYGDEAKVFTIVAQASYGTVTRTLEAVVDTGAAPPLILAWRTP